MARWLLKSEPESWSWDDQVRVGVEPWSGVRNHQAAGFLRAMRLGDTAFFYHSGAERRIVGIVEVVREAYPDPSDETGRFVMVDFKALRSFVRPVSLGQLKGDPRFADLALVRQPRLSVMPIADEAWSRICAMGDTVP